MAIGPRARAVELDVTDPESFAAFVEQAGPLDVLVNNAGIMPEGPFLEEADATTRAIFDVNVIGPINGMRAALPGMVERGRGHVVNVASMLGKMELPGLASYVASKHAVVGSGRRCAAELAGTGVTLTTVLPAVVNTELSSGITIPLSRFFKVEPEDVARAIVGSVERRPQRGVGTPLGGLVPEAARALPAPPWTTRLRGAVGDDKALTGGGRQRAAPPTRSASSPARVSRPGQPVGEAAERRSTACCSGTTPSLSAFTPWLQPFSSSVSCSMLALSFSSVSGTRARCCWTSTRVGMASSMVAMRWSIVSMPAVCSATSDMSLWRSFSASVSSATRSIASAISSSRWVFSAIDRRAGCQQVEG